MDVSKLVSTQTLLNHVNKIVLRSANSRDPNYSYWIIYDKEHTPYWVTVSAIDSEVLKAEKNIVASYQIHVNKFNMKSTKLNSRKNLVAQCKFVLKQAPNTNYVGAVLKLIYVNNEQYSHKNLGSEMFKMMLYLLSNTKASFLTGKVVDFSYSLEPELIAFYTKDPFTKVRESRTSTTLARPLSKKGTEQIINDYKLRTMNCHTKNLTYTVVFPKDRIMASSFKGKTKNETISYTSPELELTKKD